MNLLHHNEMICLSDVGDNPSVNAKDANRKRKRREDEDSDNPERSRKKVKKHIRVRSKAVMSLSSDSEDDEKSRPKVRKLNNGWELFMWLGPTKNSSIGVG